jgi:hypothetical protein
VRGVDHHVVREHAIAVATAVRRIRGALVVCEECCSVASRPRRRGGILGFPEHQFTETVALLLVLGLCRVL